MDASPKPAPQGGIAGSTPARGIRDISRMEEQMKEKFMRKKSKRIFCFRINGHGFGVEKAHERVEDADRGIHPSWEVEVTEPCDKLRKFRVFNRRRKTALFIIKTYPLRILRALLGIAGHSEK